MNELIIKGVLVLALFGFTFYKGYNYAQSQYKDEKITSLEQQQIQINENNRLQAEILKKENEVKIVYKEKIKTIETLKDTNKSLTKEVCKLSKDDAELLNKVINNE